MMLEDAARAFLLGLYIDRRMDVEKGKSERG
jgi:hypothetical protein